ncbi:unnamed protein product [Trichobilharzia szidati]|nr:unnamed protein product [Trichobilharzia szidati]
MDVDESELEGRDVVVPDQKPEEPMDILLRTARYCTTERYNSCAALSEVLQKLYRQEVSDYRAVHKKTPNPSYVPYGQLYRFMMALVAGRPLPNLSDLSSAAILDFLTCLTSIANIASDLDNGKDTCNSATDPVRTRMRVQVTNATNMVKQKIGVYMALVGAIHASSFPSIRDEITLQRDFGTHPLTPLRLLCQVKHPDTILGYPPMVKYLVDNSIMEIWKIPRVPDTYFFGETTSEPVSNEMMAPFQTIMNDFRSLCSSRLQLSKFFRTWATSNVKRGRFFPALPLPLGVIPRKRSRESSVESDQAKKCCTGNPSITTKSVAEECYTTEGTTSGQQSTVPVTNKEMEDTKNVTLTKTFNAFLIRLSYDYLSYHQRYL